MANEQQIERWAGPRGAAWTARQEQLDATLAPFGDLVLGAAAVRPGERVLDVGCGCGATTVALAGATAPHGRALGLDVSPPMLDRAGSRLRAAGFAPPRADVLQADGQTVDLAPHGPFDAIVSRFGVMFFDDPVAAFANLRDAAAPDGRLAFVCWQPVESNPWHDIPLTAVRSLLADPPPLPGTSAGPMAFADPDRTHGILSAAGWSDVRIDDASVEYVFHGLDAGAAAREVIAYISVIEAIIDGVDDPTFPARAVDAIADGFAPYATTDGVRLPAAVWLVTASASTKRSRS